MLEQQDENNRALLYETGNAHRDIDSYRPLQDRSIPHETPAKSEKHDVNLLSGAQPTLARPLKSSRASFFLIMFYSFFVIFSWVCTCILAHRPLTAGQGEWKTSYEKTKGQYGCDIVNNQGAQMWSCGGETSKLPLNSAQRASNRRWRLTLQAIGAVMAVLAIPISSAICARATVAYTQIKRNLNLRQTLALADRGWWDPFILSRLILPGGLGKYGTPFLVFAAIVCALGAVAWPLQQVLVKDVTILLVPGINDTGPTLLGYDADILGMSQLDMDSVVRDTKSKLETGTHWDQQPQLWQDPSMMCNSSSTDFTEWCYTWFNGHNNQTNLVALPGDKYWISNLVTTTNTGLIKEHSLRLNSSINCQAVPDSDYPDTCSGFETSTNTRLPDSEGSENANRSFEFKVCAPGTDQSFPWKLFRDRQEVSHSVFMQLNSDGLSYLSETSGEPDTKGAVTVRCSTATTTGYFTLPNKVDTPLAGPIMENFNLSVATDFTQYINNGSGQSFSNYGPSLDKPDVIPEPSSNPLQGPLTVSVFALFGPDTFFSARANSTFTNLTIANDTTSCTDPVPLSFLLWDDFGGQYELPPCANTTNATYFAELTEWLSVFLNVKAARYARPGENYMNKTITTALRAGIIYAEQSILSQAAAQPVWHRTLLEASGVEMRKPSVTNTSIILISVILALHLIGLWVLAIFAMSVPTWTRSLDSWALIRMGAAISEEAHADLPLLSNIRADEAEILDHMEGWVGESSTDENRRQEPTSDGTRMRSVDENGSDLPISKVSTGSLPRITIGGSRRLRRDTSYALFRSEIIEHGLSAGLLKGSWKFVKNKYSEYHAKS